MRNMGISFAPDTFYDLIGLNDKSTFEYFMRNYGFTETQYTEMSASAYGLSREYGITKGLPVKKGFFELSNYLVKNDIKTAVVTSSFRSEAIHNFQRAKIDTPFDIIIGGDCVNSGKPSGEPYLRAAEGLGLDPADCIAVEDSPNGIRSAYAAGCMPVMVPDLTEPDEELKPLLYAVVKTLADIQGIIGKE